jgi:anthranilate phosphoribosyltransferase
MSEIGMNEILTPILGKLMRGETLDGAEVDAAATEIFEGRVVDVQAAGFIVALRAKGETEEELAALVRTMHRYSVPVEVAGRAATDRAPSTCRRWPRSSRPVPALAW